MTLLSATLIPLSLFALAASQAQTERKIGADQLPAASPTLLPLARDAEEKRAAGVEKQFGNVAAGIVQYTTDSRPGR